MTTSSVVDVSPMPMPMSAHAPAANHSVSNRPSCVTSSAPPTSKPVPASTIGRAPVRSSSLPATTDAIGQPSDIAATTAPASTAVPP